MTISTTIRVGLHTTATGKTLSVYRCILSGMQGVQTDEEVIDYVRRRIACDRMFARNPLLDMIDNNNYSIERTTAWPTAIAQLPDAPTASVGNALSMGISYAKHAVNSMLEKQD